jgi:hypothetical protein
MAATTLETDVRSEVVDNLMNDLREAIEMHEPTPSAAEVVSALFSFLDVVLMNLRRIQDVEARNHNVRKIREALEELLLTHGKLVS